MFVTFFYIGGATYAQNLMKSLALSSAMAVGCLLGTVNTPALAAAQCPCPCPKTQAGAGTQAQAGTIVNVAANNKDFSTLVSALRAAGLVETLSGQGPFTVFAPTNAAFNALPQGTLERLLRPENRQTLVRILTYHVVPGTVLSRDVRPGDVRSVEGSNITVTVTGGRVRVNNANVTAVDVRGSNGVIHVIDAVILPPGLRL